MVRKKLPEFKNIDDMANFWDIHDSTDTWEARRLGMDRSTLVRMAVKKFMRTR